MVQEDKPSPLLLNRQWLVADLLRRASGTTRLQPFVKQGAKVGDPVGR
jgi:hypothetical protein